jgi:hypothetical protein
MQVEVATGPAANKTMQWYSSNDWRLYKQQVRILLYYRKSWMAGAAEQVWWHASPATTHGWVSADQASWRRRAAANRLGFGGLRFSSA